jgi:hypothetical protein
MKKYLEEVHRFIAENVVGRRSSELSDLVNEKFGTNFTKSKMRSYMKNHKLKNGLPGGLKPGERYELYPDNIKEFINKNYIGKGYKTMTILVNNTFDTNYTDGQIKGYYARNKLDSGLTGRYTKGHVPFTKGKKKYWLGGEETQFKKGNVPVNHKPVGSERVSVDGYTEIKVAEPNKWKMKHVVIWEEYNGKIPKSNCVIFGDGDKQNIDISNLMLVSRKQLVRLNQNGLIQGDIELTRTGIIIADVMSKIGERRKSVS